jgi:hypothetical protein
VPVGQKVPNKSCYISELQHETSVKLLLTGEVSLQLIVSTATWQTAVTLAEGSTVSL